MALLSRDRGFGPGGCQQQRPKQRCPPKFAGSHSGLLATTSWKEGHQRRGHAGRLPDQCHPAPQMAGTRQSELFPSPPSPRRGDEGALALDRLPTKAEGERQ